MQSWQITWRVLLGLGTLATAVSGQGIASAPLRRGTLAFDGKATLGDFTGTTTTVKGELNGAPTLAEVRGWVEAPAGSLVTGNGKRDHDMYGSLEVTKYPTIRFDLDSASAGATDGDSTAVTLHGHFAIHGVMKPATIAGWVWLTPGSTRFRGSTPLDARDYQIGGLSKMLGLLKMNPGLVVRVEVEFGGR